MGKSIRKPLRPKLTQADYDVIFNILCEPGADINKVKQAFRKVNPGTLKRAFRLANDVYQKKGALSDFEMQGVADKAEYGASIASVEKVITCYKTWDLSRGEKNIRKDQALSAFEAVYDKFQKLETEKKSDEEIKRMDRERLQHLQQLHIHDLVELAKVLHACISNPVAEEYDPEVGQIPMSVNGQDWRLDPITWFHLVMPFLSSYDKNPYVSKLWGSNFLHLKSHLGESEFWNLMKELEEKTNELQENFKKAAAIIGKSDLVFRSKWYEIQVQRETKYEPRRFPGHTEPDTDKFQPNYDSDYAEEIINKFDKTGISNFSERQLELVELLQRAYDSLEPNKLAIMITEGHCDDCPKN